MKIVMREVADLIPYINNPRKNDAAVDMVASSIKNFGFKVPIVIDGKNEIVSGHTRLKAAKKLGIDKVPCIVADDLSEQQIKAFRIADNKVSELSIWDDELLKIELEGLQDIFTGFDSDELEDVEVENPYTMKVQTPVYEITDNDPRAEDLVNRTKTNYLIEVINQADISFEDKEFLTLAAYRHLVFSYKDIADYYARADKVVQELMEQSALVIIDYENAIRNGFVSLSKTITDMMEEEDNEG
jgi:hypothetical protein